MTHRQDDRNFRLPRDVLPQRYEAHLAVDFAEKSFRGSQRVTLSVVRPVREFVVHSLNLDLTRVELRAGTRVLPARVTVLPVSETALLSFEAEIPAGEATLHVDWTGNFSDGLRGLYLAGEVAATQFEAADARRVFPCFDEPAFKARWALSVEVPVGLAVLSNGAVADSSPSGGGRQRIRFAETELLPSYLVALVAGPLVGSPEDLAGDVPVRTWALPEKAHLAHFGQQAALAALPRLQAYFGLPYAFGKLDQVAIPEFEAGAMENAGLITYRELALLVDPVSAPLSVQKRIAEVVTHELAHQWFPGLVGSDPISAPVADEALAQAVALLAVEWTHGADAARAVDAQQVTGAYLAWRGMGGEDAAADRPTSAFADEMSYGALVYGKAPGLHARQRALLGEGAFVQDLRAYVDTHRWGWADSSSLTALLAQRHPGQASALRALQRRWWSEAHGDEDLGSAETGAVPGVPSWSEVEKLMRQIEH